jgi:hypothetical protein
VGKMMCECPECGEEYKQIGNHWQFKDSHRPDIPDKSMQIIRGNLMGDGCISRRNSKNPYFILEMSEKKYIQWVEKTLPYWLVASVTKKDVSTDWGNVTVWRLTTRAHPDLSVFSEWYEDGSKNFPTGMDITPLELTCWYCGDGGVKYPDEEWKCIAIASCNEKDNWDAVNDIFETIGVDPKKNGKNIYFTKDDSKILWEYMSYEPDGFGYKFPLKYNNE